MHIVTSATLADRARALSATLALIRLVPWSIDRRFPLVPCSVTDGFHIDEAQLLVVPSVQPFGLERERLGRGMRETRSDALVVTLGEDGDGGVRLKLDAGFWRRKDNRWCGSLLLWAGNGKVALVPDPGSDDWALPVVHLVAGRMIQVGDVPWRTLGQRDAGYGTADRAIARLMAEGR